VPDALIPHKTFTGNRPSSSIMLPDLSAYTTGQILALYEHVTAAMVRAPRTAEGKRHQAVSAKHAYASSCSAAPLLAGMPGISRCIIWHRRRCAGLCVGHQQL
jgi:Phosphoglucose isomerase